MNLNSRFLNRLSLLTCAAFATFSSTHASLIGPSVEPHPTIIAGDAESDDGAPLVPVGLFSGVVSLFIETGSGVSICTGSAISKRHIITAAHCVEDSSKTGREIDLSKENIGVTSVFTDGGAVNRVIGSGQIDIHPDYQGFAVCGLDDVGGFLGACFNDDIAVVTLSADIPDDIEIYEFYRGDLPINNGQLLTMVGHGTTGNGVDGATPNSSSFFNKRFGFNYAEIFDCDDGTSVDSSGGVSNSLACEFLNGNQPEVWYADFDGIDAALVTLEEDSGLVDTFCNDFGLGCGLTLGDDFSTLFEAAAAPGDSGGPAFILDELTGTFLLAANNTFGTQGAGPKDLAGAFGEIFGGNLYAPYLDWIDDNFLKVSAPASISLFGLGALLIGLRIRTQSYT